ncbi:hypothetical protein DBR43_06080 [Pedobacter sp. KBW06]|nr:hypothetical protein DBR43_06080 [Pedobacter sp. KBW06]
MNVEIIYAFIHPKIAWRKTALVVVLLVVGLKVTAQQIQHKISADQRRQEVELIKKSFISLQPGLYGYNSPNRSTAILMKCLRRFPAPSMILNISKKAF